MSAITLDQVLEMCKDMDIAYINIKDFHIPMTDSPEAIAGHRKKIETAGLTIMGGGTITLKNDPATQDMPVVLLSAKAQSHDIELGMRVGANDYITKPPDLLDLVARVRQLLPVPAE